MLAFFEKMIANPPLELTVPFKASGDLKTREEIAAIFGLDQPDSTWYKFCNGDFMALSNQDEYATCPRSVVIDNIFCIFNGYLHNTCDLRQSYGLSRQATEAMVVVKAYKVLRDRAPYPADQLIKELDGKFSFVLYDAKAGKTLSNSGNFFFMDRDGSAQLHWGVLADGSLVCSNDLKIVRKDCGDRYTPFPSGSLFKSEEGLISFDHPLNKVRGIVREDDEGFSTAVIFQVDLFTRLYSIPRSGSDANWSGITVVEGEN